MSRKLKRSIARSEMEAQKVRKINKQIRTQAGTKSKFSSFWRNYLEQALKE